MKSESDKRKISMTEYQRLGDIYIRTREAHMQNQFSAAQIVNDLIRSLKEHMGMGTEQIIKLFHPDQKAVWDAKSEFTPMGAVKLEEDGYWHFVMGLILHPNGDLNSHPAEILLFSCKCRIQDEIPLLNIRGVNDDHDFDLSNGKYPDICKSISTTIEEFYKRRTDFIEGKEASFKIERIGFR
jgi:hypothetical protein